MTINTLTKGAVLLGGIGSSIGGYLLIDHLSSSKEKEKEKENKVVVSISDKLKNEGYTLLDFSNTSGTGWDKVKEAYKKEETGNRRFSEVKKSDDNILLTEIKDSCLQYLQGDSNNENNYKMSRRWCVVPISVTEKLKGKTLLKTEDGQEDGDWDKIVKGHKASRNDKLEGVDAKATDGEKKTEIKKQCGEKSKIETTDFAFEDALNQVDLWCTKESATKIS